LGAESDILKLRDLLAPPRQNESDDEDDEREKRRPYAIITKTGHGSPIRTNTTGKQFIPPLENPDPLDPESVDKWIQQQEKLELDKYNELEHKRAQPEYEIIYKQQVSTEDVYLQLGNKTASSASCESMVIRIKLPKTSSRDINLDIQQQLLDLSTSNFKLVLPLPHAVHPHKGQAAWDQDTETLAVTLYIDREYDFINF